MSDKWLAPEDFTDEEARTEANRCLSCKKPLCQTGCPTGMRIRDFILALKQDNLDEASRIIADCSSLSNVCSVVCPHENQCVGHCVLGKMHKPIQVGRLERYVQNKTQYEKKIQDKKDWKIAIVGAGPAGLSAAKELLAYGFAVDIYEKEKVAGGVMTYGIPSYRLEYRDVLRIVEEVQRLGGNFFYGRKLLESDIIALRNTYDYVFVSTGLTKVRKLGIPNDGIEGVYDALDFLMQMNYAVKLKEGVLPMLYGTVVVVGAGNVAMDAARSAVRLGADKVIIAYRRSLEEAPATKHEIHDATSEGVEFKFLTNPVKVLGTERVTGVLCEIMRLTEPDESGRRRPVGTNEFMEIPCDFIISAIGQIPEDIYNESKITTDQGYICAEGLKTNIDRIYVGGDIHLGAKTVVEAMRCGREFAKIVLASYEQEYTIKKDKTANDVMERN